MTAEDWLADLPEPEVKESPSQREQPLALRSMLELPLAEGAQARDYGLRWYQGEAYSAVFAEFERGIRATLLVMATGLGKTRTFGAIAGDWAGCVLILCHRDELVEQAIRDLEAILGEPIGREQADHRCGDERVVVASIDTIKQQRRMERLGKGRFSLLICDEAHHYIAKTYRRPLDFWSDAKVLGVTATPDRGDGKAMGKIFQSVAYSFGIAEGIEQGYLVPIHAHSIEVTSLDISNVQSVGGDLVAAQLDEAILKVVGSIVSETLKYEPDRQAIVYLPGVKSAELTATLFNERETESTGFICGTTPKDGEGGSRDIFKRMRSGELKRLSNCMIATEGTDIPPVSCIVMGRPSKSRNLVTQCAGRGGRVLSGVVDHIPGKERAAERRAAIAASAKPNCIILDFVGNMGKHKLITPVDILGGSYSEEEKAEAKKKLKEGGGNVMEALQNARAALRRIAQQAHVTATSTRTTIDPFGALGMVREAPRLVDVGFGYKAMTQGQKDFLLKAGVKAHELEGISRADAQRLQSCIHTRRRFNYATLSQMRELKMHGVTKSNVPFGKAKEALAYVFATKRTGKVDPSMVQRILYGAREPGQEG